MTYQQCLILFRPYMAVVRLQSAPSSETQSNAAGVTGTVKAVAFLPAAFCDNHHTVVEHFNRSGVHILRNGDELCSEGSMQLFVVECFLDENIEETVDSGVLSMILTSERDYLDRKNLEKIFYKTSLEFRRKGSSHADAFTRLAIDEQNDKVFKNLSRCLRCLNENLLSAAIVNGPDLLVKLLLEHGVDVITTGVCISPPLHHAALQDNSDLVRLLIERGALVDRRDQYGRTPLHCAAERNCLNSAKALLHSGADIKLRCLISGRTSLHLAAENGSDSSKLVQLLIDKGTDVNATDKVGMTPLHCADNLEAVRILLNNGADLNCADNYYKLSPLLRHLFSPGDRAIIKTFLDFGARIDIKFDSKNGPTINDKSFLTKYFQPIRDYCKLEYLLNRCFVHVDFEYDTKPPRWSEEIDRRTISIFARHLVRIVSLNLKDRYGFDPADFWEEHDTFQRKPLSAFTEECEMEVKRMKRHLIKGTDLSLHELSTKNEQQVARLLRNHSVTLDTEELKEMYPEYGEMLTCAVEKGRNRHSWEEQAIAGVNFLSGDFKGMPDEIKDNIVRWLNIVDIRNVKRACALYS